MLSPKKPCLALGLGHAIIFLAIIFLVKGAFSIYENCPVCDIKVNITKNKKHPSEKSNEIYVIKILKI